MIGHPQKAFPNFFTPTALQLIVNCPFLIGIATHISWQLHVTITYLPTTKLRFQIVCYSVQIASIKLRLRVGNLFLFDTENLQYEYGIRKLKISSREVLLLVLFLCVARNVFHLFEHLIGGLFIAGSIGQVLYKLSFAYLEYLKGFLLLFFLCFTFY